MLSSGCLAVRLGLRLASGAADDAARLLCSRIIVQTPALGKERHSGPQPRSDTAVAGHPEFNRSSCSGAAFMLYYTCGPHLSRGEREDEP